MRLVYVMFDSLNRAALGAYGCREIATPNFDRLAARSVIFDNHYVGSLPCMPARRDLHTGRLNFLHRPWGPLEPFDNSYPEVLRGAGVYSHLVTDHYHYFEDGGAGYHGRYSSWEFIRGQEKDKWKGVVKPPLERFARDYHAIEFDGRTDINANLPYFITRDHIRGEADFPIARCVDAALEFLERNRRDDGWVLHFESFDPHEPFFAAAQYRDGLPTGYRGPVLDWPRYGQSTLSEVETAELRANYLALVRMCDAHLGRILDVLDRHDMWADTAVILTTDHGLLLGEHAYWGKNRPPFYNEVVHIPLLIAHPEVRDRGGAHVAALSQAIDLMPTILEMFGAEIPVEVRGHSLLPLLHEDRVLRQACIFGQFGGATNITDGRFTYFRYPRASDEERLYHYTLMPAHMRTLFEPIELADAELAGPFDFTKGARLLRLPVVAEAKANMRARYPLLDARTALFDLSRDPGQLAAVDAPAEEARLLALMHALMRDHDAPPEAYRRLGLAA